MQLHHSEMRFFKLGHYEPKSRGDYPYHPKKGVRGYYMISRICGKCPRSHSMIIGFLLTPSKRFQRNSSIQPLLTALSTSFTVYNVMPSFFQPFANRFQNAQDSDEVSVPMKIASRGN